MVDQAGDYPRFGGSARTIRIPSHMVETISEYASEEAIDTGLGREPMPEEIAAEMGMEVDKVRHIIKISQETVSLETPLGIITKIPRWANFRR